MATFAKGDFSHSSYAAFRPTYPPELYNIVYKYHQGPKHVCIDLGCGPGIVTRHVASDFGRVIGIDPSSGMIAQAQDLTPKSDFPNTEFHKGPAECLPHTKTGSVDAVLIGQAVHWFDHARFFAEMSRILRSEGTLAYWDYTDHVLVDYPKATEILHRHCLDRGGGNDKADDPDRLGYYWERPGRSLVENFLRDITPPLESFKDTERIEYEPATDGPRSGKGNLLLHRRMTIGECKAYMRTWSTYHSWMEAHPGRATRQSGGNGDVVDSVFDEIAEAQGWSMKDLESMEVEIEWGTVLILTRKK